MLPLAASHFESESESEYEVKFCAVRYFTKAGFQLDRSVGKPPEVSADCKIVRHLVFTQLASSGTFYCSHDHE